LKNRRGCRNVAVLVLLIAGRSLIAAEYYASPGGNAAGDGSPGRPWDLRSALAKREAIRPGDTLYLQGGIYTADEPLESRLQGTAEAPIVIRPVKGEHVVIAGERGGLSVHAVSEYTHWYDLEVVNPKVNRDRSVDDRPAGVTVHGPHSKFVNFVVRNSGQGFGFWGDAVGSEIYGSLIYYVGNNQRAHGIYTQNNDKSRPKVIEDNVIFGTAGCGVHAYGSGNAKLLGFRLKGNIVFNNGSIVGDENSYAILVGGGTPADDVQIVENVVFQNTGSAHKDRGIRMGYGQGSDDSGAVFDNYVQGLTPFIQGNPWTELALRGNTFVRRSEVGSPADRIFVRPNRYEAGRANIAVVNGRKLSTVEVDLAGVLARGARYEIRDVQDYFGRPVVTGVFDGRPVALPINLTRTEIPAGNVQSVPRHTAPEFAAFVVRTVSEAGNTPKGR
jgi:hypothetical protein